jgi:hypothetical protein
MSSILDNALLVGKESTYGTAAALSRAYEGKSDSFKRAQEFLTSTGFRGGMHTQLATRSVPVNMGGEGSIEVDVQPTGFGLLFQSMLGGTTAPAQQGATTAYKSTFVSTAAGPTDSWTVQMQRVDAGGTVRSFTHLGSTMTGWKFTQETDGLLGVEFMFDFQDVVTSVSAGTPTYVDSLPYAWTQAAATWDGTAVDLTKLELEGSLGFNTERRFLRGSALKKKPVRASVPEFKGSAEMEFESLTHYNAFVSGETAPLVLTWTGDEIDVALRLRAQDHARRRADPGRLARGVALGDAQAVAPVRRALERHRSRRQDRVHLDRHVALIPSSWQRRRSR